MNLEIYNQVLQNCLERLLEGGSRLDGVISDYPQFANRLRIDLETASRMQLQSSAFDPRRGFIKSNRDHLLGRLNQQTKIVEIIPQIALGRRGYFTHLALAVLIVMVIVLTGGSVVFTAGDSLPGDPLYQIRNAAETLQLVLTPNEVKDAELHLQFSQDYLVACAVLVSQGRQEDASYALRIYERHIAGTGRILLELSPENDRDLNSLQSDFNRTFLQDIEILKRLLPGEF
jgi:hypothetical protein